jgi:hypothetical protein
MSKMTREAGTGIVMQVFTNSRVQAVTNGVAWVPGANDRVFSAPVAFTGIIYNNTVGGVQAEIPLAANVARGLEGVASITFDADGLIEVM